ncbi:hypothetical protein JF66_06100 [Cryobacterium sp. MLB-32]|uniref:hypothetical protein n=1 Tax=Cryobacterium sp. MLB-32 TaxID=1529318 RepID=UPI0004E72B67|nr:hypothetical protein [Cryobacterium sp. MLB-32]KFF60169.1 hypothetical protein JF66_06100 [Cryobacterium sp. MLB-32]
MTSKPDNDALSWGGDDDPTLMPGSAKAASEAEVEVEGEPEGPSNPDTAERFGADDSRGTEWTEDGETADAVASGVAGSAALVFMGILAGFYLLYTIGWFIGVGRIATPVTEDPVAAGMFSLGTWLAVAAPIVWFAASFWLTNGRPRLRVMWLLIGVVVLVPTPLLMGVNA